MLLPKPLSDGATIGIISPAGRIDAEIIHYAEKSLKAMGYRVLVGRNATNIYHQFAGNDQNRAADLQEMLSRNDVEAVICARGGYGMIRIIDKIDFDSFSSQPKWIVGFSDITVLHACLQNRLQIASVHGPMPKNFPDKSMDDPDMQALFQILRGQMPVYQYKAHELNRDGTAEGLLIGGNLSLIYALRATPYDFDPKGKILFIEDLSEYLYHLDRMMQNLRLSGFLQQLNGMIIGQFTDMKDNSDGFGQTAYEIIKEAVRAYDYPVVFDFPAGHTSLNMPLILGKKVRLEAGHQQIKLHF